jgi:predicted RNA binding protein YcfA (HicA-like mRNA interferase family)
MPGLRSLSGADVVKILERFGFSVISIKSSHHKIRRVVDAQKQTLHVPVHGKKALPPGTLKGIYRQALAYIPEPDLKPHFYAD